MIVKVCGMREAENIRRLDELGIADWMGFIFYPRSPRYVSLPPSHLPHHCKRVGVFVNAAIDEMVQRSSDFRLDIIQLHGSETPEFCHDVRRSMGENIQIIKTIAVESESDLDRAAHYEGQVDYFLFETKSLCYGGSGRQFDWTILHNYCGHIPFLITGGITPDDVQRVRTFSHPQFAGIDLNSRFETTPGVKDIEKLHVFIDLIRQS